jgi:hypothetical protein
VIPQFECNAPGGLPGERYAVLRMEVDEFDDEDDETEPQPEETARDLVAIRVFSSESEAGIAKGALEAFGIPCITGGANAVGEYPNLRMAQGIPLLVRAEDAERAEQVLGAPPI